MIYEITQTVQDFLTSHNKEQLSFFQEMTVRKEQVYYYYSKISYLFQKNFFLKKTAKSKTRSNIKRTRKTERTT